MIKKAVFALAATAASCMALATSSAMAADVPASPVYNWTGAYIGLTGGYLWGNGDVSASGSTLADGLSPLEGYDGFDTINFAQAVEQFSDLKHSDSSGSWMFGANLGYNQQLSDLFVVGLDINLTKTDLSVGAKASNSAFVGYDGDGYEGTDINGKISTSANVEWLHTFAGRLGILATPDLMLFGTGGVALGEVSVNNSSTMTFSGHDAGADTSVEYNWSGDPNCDVNTSCNTGTFNSSGGKSSSWRMGYVLGGGLEYAIAPSWSLRAEAMYWNLGKASAENTLTVTGSYEGSDDASLVTKSKGSVSLDGYLARATVAFHF